ncbi:hypothetical protein LBMAG42_56890 [Deltaproteobacteria bacterium]|nr:hypothetical protein LBMAG42_56890 [Deltaproteobacteria bacterium]
MYRSAAHFFGYRTPSSFDRIECDFGSAEKRDRALRVRLLRPRRVCRAVGGVVLGEIAFEVGRGWLINSQAGRAACPWEFARGLPNEILCAARQGIIAYRIVAVEEGILIVVPHDRPLAGSADGRMRPGRSPAGQ